MRPRSLLLASALVLSAIIGSPRAARTLPSPPAASRASGAPAPEIALLATQPGALHTSLYVARYVAPGGGSFSLSAPLATFTHLPGATVRAAVLPGTSTILAAADTADSRDLSFDASLFRIDPHAPPELLCDRVVHASRPLVTPEGRAFVSRGVAGPAPVSSRLEDMRIDALSIDEVDPMTGNLRTLFATSGYLAFLAGSYGPEVIVYRVGPGGADILAVDADTGKTREIVPSLPPFARDFSVDAATGTLVYQGRHETDSHTWTIESVDLVTGQRSRLLSSPSMNMVPHALPGGAIAYSPQGREGLTILGGAGSLAPFGEGADWILASSADDNFLAGLHTEQGRLSRPFVVDVDSGIASVLPAPEGAHIAIAGFLPSEGGAL